MQLKNEHYDTLKWMTLIFLPALAVFVQGVGELYGISNTELHVGTLNLITVFCGSILQLSSMNYKDNDSMRGAH